jgi:outer membrane protein OmpA-like peptidoglycan-associated protein
LKALEFAIFLFYFLSFHIGFSQKIALPRCINSSFSELLPKVAPDNQVLYFVRVSENNIQNIWVAPRLNDTTWGEPKPLPPPLNSSLGANAVIAVSCDGKRLFLQNKYLPNGKMEPGVSISKQVNREWQFPKSITISNFFNRSQFLNLQLASDEKTLLLSFEGKDSNGGLDLYVSFLLNDSVFSTPLNLGKTINTPFQETSPFLAPDGVTLYFTSDGHKGYGKGDIFFSRRLDSSWQTWSEPQNLGETINSPEFEGYFSLSPEGRWAYFCSYPQKGARQTDIFKATLPPSLKPLPIVKVKGTVANLHNCFIDASQVLALNLDTEKIIATAPIFFAESSFEFWLPSRHSYLITAEPFERFPEPVVLESFKISQDTTVNIKLYCRENRAPRNRILLESILFHFSHSSITREAESKLQKLLSRLKEMEYTRIELEGHTDNLGNAYINQTLARKRAESVKRWLIGNGISERMITITPYGSKLPVAENETEQGRMRNRRVEIFLITP